MNGRFILNRNDLPMTAQQILALPAVGFVWQTRIGSGLMRFTGLQNMEPMRIRLDAEGNPTEVWALRWTNANPERVYRLQPFGGRMLEMTDKQGFRIPSRVELGNLWGTPDYVPFFLATITRAEF